MSENPNPSRQTLADKINEGIKIREERRKTMSASAFEAMYGTNSYQEQRKEAIALRAQEDSRMTHEQKNPQEQKGRKGIFAWLKGKGRK